MTVIFKETIKTQITRDFAIEMNTVNAFGRKWIRENSLIHFLYRNLIWSLFSLFSAHPEPPRPDGDSPSATGRTDTPGCSQ